MVRESMVFNTNQHPAISTPLYLIQSKSINDFGIPETLQNFLLQVLAYHTIVILI